MGRNCLKLHFRKQKSSTKASLPTRSTSNEDLKKLEECLETMDADVSKLFRECEQPELRNDLKLCGLVKDYFKAIKEVTELCDSLKKFLLKAPEDQNHKCHLVAEFHERSKSCHEDLAKMIGTLVTTMKQMNKKLKRVRGKRAMVTTAIVAPAIAGIVGVAIIAPAAIVMIKGIVEKVPMEELFKSIASKWKRYTRVLKGEKTAMASMEEGMRRTLIKVDKIIVQLETLQESFLFKAEDSKSILVDLEKQTQLCDSCNQLYRQEAFGSVAKLLSSPPDKNSLFS